jgi:hypothetical protein
MAANTHAFQPAQPLAADGAALAYVLDRAGVTKTSLIRATGFAGPTAVLWLNNHGYERAAYVHAHWISVMEPVDALLIPHTCTAEALSNLLQGGGGLREGGALIVQSVSGRDNQGSDSIHGVLRPLGFMVESRVHDKGRNIYIARRVGFGFNKAA